MTNFALSAVEGDNTGPIGSIHKFPASFPSVFSLDGFVYSKSDVPARVIPDFDVNVPSALKGFVQDPSLFTMSNANLSSIAAGGEVACVSNDGTIIRMSVESSNTVTVDRKLAGEPTFTTITLNATTLTRGFSRALMVTDHAGSWIASINSVLLRSDDNGLTWNTTSLPLNSNETVFDIKWASNGTILMVARPSVTASRTIYRSTDKGKTWTVSTSAASVANPLQVAYIGSNTWVAIRASVAITQKSTDDGVTWVADATLPFTPGTTNATNFEFSNGRYYFQASAGGALWTGSSIAGMTTAVGVNPYGLGVDDSGNALCVVAGGTYRHVSNTGVVTSIQQRDIRFFTTVTSRLYFAVGTWVDYHGSFITNADLLAQKSFNAQRINASGKIADTSTSTGVSIIALNVQSYLRSTDNWETFEVRQFNTDTTAVSGQAATGNPHIVGTATDSNGNWVIAADHPSTAPVFLCSSDEGLTWTTRTQTFSAGSILGIVGGSVAGKFLAISGNGAYLFTSDTFASASTAVPGQASLVSYNPGYHNGIFWFFTYNGSTTYNLSTIAESTGVATNYALDVNLNLTGMPVHMVTYKNTAYVGNASVVVTATTPIVSAGAPATVLNVIDGKINAVSNLSYQLGEGKALMYLPARGQSLWAQGLTNVTLSTNEFIKVS